MLGWLYKSPKYFKYRLNKEEEQSNALKVGTMIHLALLEPNLFSVSKADKPTGKLGKFVDTYLSLKGVEEKQRREIAYQESGFDLSFNVVCERFEKPAVQEFIQEFEENEGRIGLDSKTKYIVDNCVQSVLEDETAFNLINQEGPHIESINELEVYWEDEIKRKAKIDRLVINYKDKVAVNIDLKSTSEDVFIKPVKVNDTGDLLQDYIYRGFSRSYIKYAYYRQQAYYEDAIKHFLGTKDVNVDDWSIEHKIIAVETSVPFNCSVYSFSRKWIEKGKEEVNDLLNKLKWHKETNYWEKPKDYPPSGFLI